MKKQVIYKLILATCFITTILFCKRNESISANKNVTISAVGDIMCYMVNIKLAHDKETGNYDFSNVYREIRPLVQKGDIALGNFETTLPGGEAGYSDYPKFGSPDNLLHTLKWAGFDILNIANNHIFDRGEEVLIRTIEMMNKKGIAPIGVFKDKYNYDPILIRYVNGFKIAFLSYTYSTNGAGKPRKPLNKH